MFVDLNFQFESILPKLDFLRVLGGILFYLFLSPFSSKLKYGCQFTTLMNYCHQLTSYSPLFYCVKNIVYLRNMESRHQLNLLY